MIIAISNVGCGDSVGGIHSTDHYVSTARKLHDLSCIPRHQMGRGGLGSQHRSQLSGASIAGETIGSPELQLTTPMLTTFGVRRKAAHPKLLRNPQGMGGWEFRKTNRDKSAIGGTIRRNPVERAIGGESRESRTNPITNRNPIMRNRNPIMMIKIRS